SVNQHLRGLSENPEGISEKESELVDCFKYANGFNSCYPEPQGGNACHNQASKSLSPNERLANELLDRVLTQKQLQVTALKDWLAKNTKGFCHGKYSPAFSAKIRSVLKCETGMEYSNACLANGELDQSSVTPAAELSCAHVCASGKCDGEMPRMSQRNTLDGNFGAASGVNGVAPVALGPSYVGGKMCSYHKSGSGAYEAPH